MANNKRRLFAWSTITAKFVNWSIATPNWGEPGIPSVCRVLNGLETVSTIDADWPPKFDVRTAPVWGFTAKAVGLIPTLTPETPLLSGLNVVIRLEPLELA